jgi:hypothetical protein
MTIAFRLLLPLAAVLFLSSCASTRRATAPQLKDDNLTYVNKISRIELRLPRIRGWTAGIPEKDLARNIVYGAIHMGKILNLVLSVEPLNSDLEDYFILIRRANDFEGRPGYQKMALDTFTLSGQKALRYVYKADVVSVDSMLLAEDSLPRDTQGMAEDSSAAEDSTEAVSPYILTPYVYTNILMKYEEFDYWLEISTLEEGYERRKPFIEEVVRGLEVLK